MGDAGTVSLRFTVANAEVVRQALQQLGKDGEKALRQFDSSAKSGGGALAGLSDIVDNVRGRLSGFAAQGGFLAQVIGRWGPLGLTAAAGLGVAYIALQKISEITDAFVAKQTRVKEMAQTLSLTTSEMQTLARAGSKQGVDFDSVTNSVGRFAVAMDEVRKAQGGLYDAVRRVDPELAQQLAATKDNARALDLLAAAYAKAGDSQQRLLRDAFGRGGLEMGRVLDELSRRGGLSAAANADLESGKNLTDEFLGRIRSLRIEIDSTNRATDKMLGEWLSESTLQREKAKADAWASLAQSMKAIAEGKPSDAWSNFANAFTQAISGWKTYFGGSYAPTPVMTEQQRAAFRQSELRSWDTPLPGAGASSAGGGNDKLSAEAQLNIFRERVALLGQAITPADALKLKTLELAAATEKDATLRAYGNKGLAAFILAQNQAAVAMRERLGIVTESELLEVRLAELNDQRAKGFIKNADEMAAAEQLVRRQVAETMKQLEVRASATPGLTRWRQEATDLTASLDRLSVQGLDQASQSLVDFETGSKRAGVAFNDFVLNFGRGVLDMLNKRLLLAPVASALEGFVKGLLPGAGGGGAFDANATAAARSALGNVFIDGQIVPHRMGGIVDRLSYFPMRNGGIGSIAEDEPEGILPLRRGRGGRLGVDASGIGAGAVAVQSEIKVAIVNGSDGQISAKQTKAPAGFDIGILVESVDQGLAQRQSEGSGHLARVLRTDFGVARKF